MARVQIQGGGWFDDERGYVANVVRKRLYAELSREIESLEKKIAYREGKLRTASSPSLRDEIEDLQRQHANRCDERVRLWRAMLDEAWQTQREREETDCFD